MVFFLTLGLGSCRCDEERIRAVLLLMYYAGLRVGQAASLQICDVIDNELGARLKPSLQLKSTYVSEQQSHCACAGALLFLPPLNHGRQS